MVKNEGQMKQWNKNEKEKVEDLKAVQAVTAG
jgi:hypothetical protein